MQHLSRFVDEVIAHVCNRATAREQSSYHHFHVYRADEVTGGVSIESPLPERDDSKSERSTPPAEHSVLVGWCESDQHLDWIRRTGLYNFRAGLRRGSIRLEPAIAGARHLLLHGHANKAWPGLWRIMKRGLGVVESSKLAVGSSGPQIWIPKRSTRSSTSKKIRFIEDGNGITQASQAESQVSPPPSLLQRRWSTY